MTRAPLVTMLVTMKPMVIKAGEFKAKCLELMDRVAATGQPIVITKRGTPVAQLAPATVRPSTLRGFMRGQLTVVGDIVSPIDAKWDAEA